MSSPAHVQDSPADLVAACVDGEPDAWRRLVERFSPLVWTVARSHRLSPTDCQDVYQSTWLQAVQHLHSLREPARLAAWLVTATRRECLKFIARTDRYLPVGADSPLIAGLRYEGEAPEDHALRSDERREVLDAFRRLPTRDQSILGLLMTDPPPSYDEISRTLGLPRGSIGPLRQRALARMRELLPPRLASAA